MPQQTTQASHDWPAPFADAGASASPALWHARAGELAQVFWSALGAPHPDDGGDLWQAQEGHWQQLLAGPPGDAERQSAQDLGRRYQAAGLTTARLVAAYHQVLDAARETGAGGGLLRPGRDQSRALGALQTALFQDMQALLEGHAAARAEAEASRALQDFADQLMDSSVELSVGLNRTAMTNAFLTRALEHLRERAQSASSGIEEMSTGISSISDSSRSANDTAQATRDAAYEGGRVVQNAVDTVGSLTRKVVDAAERADTLAEESRGIGQIVQTIDDIAEQTNLLALNATIEASRAGEAGKGFAVVADEVKSLANQTVRATEDIRQRVDRLVSETRTIVDSMQEAKSATDRSEEVMSQAKSAMDDIVSKAEDVTERMNEISSVLSQQESASKDASNGIAEIAKSASDNAREVQQVVDGLDAQERLIKEVLNRFLDQEVPDKVIRIAKADHVLWKKRLVNMLVGREGLQEAELKDHHACRLGQWHDGPSADPYRRCPSFPKIEQPHQEVHRLGIECARAIENDDETTALQKLEEMETPSRTLMDLLDRLRRERRG